MHTQRSEICFTKIPTENASHNSHTEYSKPLHSTPSNFLGTYMKSSSQIDTKLSIETQILHLKKKHDNNKQVENSTESTGDQTSV